MSGSGAAVETELNNYPEYRQLLAAVCDCPEDDTPRLVLADWLQEHSCEARAEFIRVQIKIARAAVSDQCPLCYTVAIGGQHTNGPCRCAPTLRALKARQSELFRGLDFPILGHDKPIQGLRLTQRHIDECELLSKGLVRRGFVEQVTCRAADWLQHGDAIRAQHPVQKVQLTTQVYWIARPHDGAPFRLYGDPAAAEFSDEAVGALMRPKRGTDEAMSLIDAVLTLRYPGITFKPPPA